MKFCKKASRKSSTSNKSSFKWDFRYVCTWGNTRTRLGRCAAAAPANIADVRHWSHLLSVVKRCVHYCWKLANSVIIRLFIVFFLIKRFYNFIKTFLCLRHISCLNYSIVTFHADDSNIFKLYWYYTLLIL